MIIPARYTEVLDNLLRNDQARADIEEAMSHYPLYATDPDAERQFGTAYKVPTRAELNQKILDHYRFREIGQETFGRWLFELKTALNEIMPKYNQLFYSADQDFNPIYNVDYKKTMVVVRIVHLTLALQVLINLAMKNTLRVSTPRLLLIL